MLCLCFVSFVVYLCLPVLLALVISPVANEIIFVFVFVLFLNLWRREKTGGVGMKKVPTFVTTGPSDRANVTKIIIIIMYESNSYYCTYFPLNTH